MFRVKQEAGRQAGRPPSSLVSPKRVVGGRGGSRYIEGCWGFPYLEIKKFLGLKVSTFQNFKISKLNAKTLRCVVHAFQNESKFQIFKEPEIICSNDLGCVLNYFEYLYRSKVEIIGSGLHVHFHYDRKSRKARLSDFWKVEV